MEEIENSPNLTIETRNWATVIIERLKRML